MTITQGIKREGDESFDDRVAKIRRRLYKTPRKLVMESQGITDDDIREMFHISDGVISAQSPNYKPSVAMATGLAKFASIKGSEKISVTTSPCFALKTFPHPWRQSYTSITTERISSQQLSTKLDGAVYASYILRLDVRKNQLKYWIEGYDEKEVETSKLMSPAWGDFGADRLARLKEMMMDEVLECLRLENTAQAKMYAERHFQKRPDNKVKAAEYRFYQLSDLFDKVPLLLLNFGDPAPVFWGYEAEKAD